MFQRFEKGAFETATATEPPEPHLWGVATKSDAVGVATQESFLATGCPNVASMAMTDRQPTQEQREKRSGAAEDGARKIDGIVQLSRMSREIFRDLGVKEAAIAAYFARYDNARAAAPKGRDRNHRRNGR